MQCEVGTSLGHVRCSLALALVELVLHWNLAELVHWVHWPPWAVEVFVLLVHWVLLALPWVAGLSVRWHLFFSTGGGSLNGGGCLKLSDATGATAWCHCFRCCCRRSQTWNFVCAARLRKWFFSLLSITCKWFFSLPSLCIAKMLSCYFTDTGQFI